MLLLILMDIDNEHMLNRTLLAKTAVSAERREFILRLKWIHHTYSQIVS